MIFLLSCLFMCILLSAASTILVGHWEGPTKILPFVMSGLAWSGYGSKRTVESEDCESLLTVSAFDAGLHRAWRKLRVGDTVWRSWGRGAVRLRGKNASRTDVQEGRRDNVASSQVSWLVGRIVERKAGTHSRQIPQDHDVSHQQSSVVESFDTLPLVVK